MSRIGLINNPNSGPTASADKCSALESEAARHLVPVVTTRNPDEIADALRSFARAGVEVLAIHGGDGTVDAVLTRLRRDNAFKQEPVLAIIPGGTTNMTHSDVGTRRRGANALGHLAAACLDGIPHRRVRSRRVLRVDRGGNAPPFYGFFFATAAVPRLIHVTRKRLHRRGLTGWTSEAIALLWSLRRLVSGRVARDSVMHPDRIAYAVDDGDWKTADMVILMATTLERLILGLRPARPGGRMGVAGLMWPYRRLGWRLPGFVRGRGDGELGDDLGRTTADRLRLRLDCDYTIDGELFDAPQSGEITLSATEPARFLVV